VHPYFRGVTQIRQFVDVGFGWAQHPIAWWVYMRCFVLNIQQVHPTNVAETVRHNTPVSDPCMSVSVDSVQKPSLNILSLSQAILRHPCRLLKLVIRLADVHADTYATLKRTKTLNWRSDGRRSLPANNYAGYTRTASGRSPHTRFLILSSHLAPTTNHYSPRNYRKSCHKPRLPI
jgi:hypothetical protein